MPVRKKLKTRKAINSKPVVLIQTIYKYVGTGADGVRWKLDFRVVISLLQSNYNPRIV
jgi:hypothetical protein